MNFLPFRLLMSFLCLAPPAARSVDDQIAAAAREAAGQITLPRGQQMRYGPVLACSINAPSPDAAPRKTPASALAPPYTVAGKSLVIQLGEKDEAYVCFDTEQLRMSAAWTDGFLDLRRSNIGTLKGDGNGGGYIAGDLLFHERELTGWYAVADKSANEFRPATQRKWRGFYMHGRRIVLAYRVEDCEVLEMPETFANEDGRVLIRHFTIGPAAGTLRLILPDGVKMALIQRPEEIASHARQVAVQAGANAREAIEIAPRDQPFSFTLTHWRSAKDRPILPTSSLPVFFTAGASPPLRDLRELRGGGPANWPEPIVTSGSIAKDDAAYVMDTVALPDENPWRSWMRLTAIDFFPDGRAAVSTLNGDVWLVSGLDARLDQVRWKRFAVGLYEPLGLKIVDGKIYVNGKDQITRLHDMNGDGEADFYECFFHERPLHPGYHTFTYDLQTDRAGNFLFAVGGHQVGPEREGHNALFRVTPDGSSAEIIATGFRAPNGVGVGPNDEIVVTDNQGQWMPASKVNLVKPGGFYGFVADPRIEPDAPAPETFDQPLCYIPMHLDSSSSGPLWVSGGKWGPFEGRLLHTSFGASTLFAVLHERVGDVAQGGVVRFPVKFTSGAVRSRFAPHDGQLYTVGLSGWQSNAAREGCFHRVRYTGQPVHLPIGLSTGKDAITIQFAEPLDEETAADPDSYAIQQWNYKWAAVYGSPDLSVEKPGAKGRDDVEVRGVQLSPDKRAVTLETPGLKPVMQMNIRMDLKAASGAAIRAEIANTINRVPQE